MLPGFQTIGFVANRRYGRNWLGSPTLRAGDLARLWDGAGRRSPYSRCTHCSWMREFRIALAQDDNYSLSRGTDDDACGSTLIGGVLKLLFTHRHHTSRGYYPGQRDDHWGYSGAGASCNPSASICRWHRPRADPSTWDVSGAGRAVIRSVDRRSDRDIKTWAWRQAAVQRSVRLASRRDLRR